MNGSKDHKAAAEPPLDCRVGRGKQPGWKRRGHRSLEVAEYMHALAEERSRHGEMEAAQWGKLARMQEQLDDVAAALGISVDKSDWWDQSTDQKVAKLIGRATVLRGLVPNAKVSGAGTASAGLPGYAGDNNGER